MTRLVIPAAFRRTEPLASTVARSAALLTRTEAIRRNYWTKLNPGGQHLVCWAGFAAFLDRKTAPR